MSEFTKGPWVVTQIPDEEHGGFHDFVWVDEKGSKTGNIATCYSVNPHDALANAHLIAAAPELYEALRLIRIAMYTERSGVYVCIGCGAVADCSHSPDCEFRNVDAALAKAKGKA